MVDVTAAEPRVDLEDESFERFFDETEPRLRRALMAAYGSEAGREATAEAFAWAWEHRHRLPNLDYPVRYLYRVGQSRTRRRKLRVLHGRHEWTEPWVEPDLARGLGRLSQHQRVAVVLVHGYSWTVPEVAELLDVKPTTAQTHLERGLARLRTHLKVTLDD
jgi:DNA-directed RNA polymerase specialized sigma24 family protein